ncbi:MAG TPA: hypothetical protein VIH93_03330 [Thermoanaerobaculia bacterium]
MTAAAPGSGSSGRSVAELLARLPLHPGLCAACVHLELADSGRSVFVRCGLAASDPRFARYPPLPVASCSGYREVESS